MTARRLAVVVPTRNRSTHLPALVRSLAEQTVAVDIVFVDDGSTDDTATVLRAEIESTGARARVERLDRSVGPATARNAGWRATDAHVVAFLDDDCVPDRRWAESLCDALRTADVVQGRTLPDPTPSRPRGPFSHTISIQQFSWRFESCNIAYRRDVLERTTGFDEAFPDPYGEDIDLGWRAMACGATASFSADALVHHAITHSNLAARLRAAPRMAAMPHVVRRHPGYRSQLHAGVFTDRSHGWAILAAGGVAAAAATRRWRPLLALSPYVVHRTLTEPLWQRWKAPVSVPGALALDLAAVGVLARGSVRARTLVL